MKNLLLALFISLFTLNCQTIELKEIKEIDKIYQGLWIVTQISTDQGKTYYTPTSDISFKFNQNTIVLGNGTILFVNKVLEATEKKVYFNVIVFDNNDELFTITRIKEHCMIAIFSIDRIETTRVIVKWQKSDFI